MAFCIKCGTSVPDDIKFCTSCGSPMGETGVLPVTEAPAQQIQAAPPPFAYHTPPTQPQQPPPYEIAAPQGMNPAMASEQALKAPPKKSKYGVMGVGAYVVHSILFNIPLVGWLICIIIACAAKNLNRRNFARGMIVLYILGIAVTMLAYLLVRLYAISVREVLLSLTGDV
ncbi:MAG: zinc ribbon domain-containing protein [Oscillospiraceae bacterium]|nr:zinc ribbon domain-containing protein [Oscillospiraceae bacterium]